MNDIKNRDVTLTSDSACLDNLAAGFTSLDQHDEAGREQGDGLYQALIEHASDAIMIVQHGQVTYRNRAHEKWFGFSADGSIAPSLLMLAAAENRDFVAAYEQALRRGEAIPDLCEMILMNQDGQRLHLEVTSYVVPHQGTLATVLTMRELRGYRETEVTSDGQYAATSDLQEHLKSARHVGGIVGASPALHQVLQQVEQVASTDATVLLTGETGTGKELIVRALHHLSPRRDHPLVKVNCTALPDGLIESELFGHEKGAFTGAIARKLGRFELAEGGTLFLDEIGDLSIDVQAKLLRVLQEGEFERVGGDRTLSSNVRVVAATHRDLKHAVSANAFRADLFYRLHVFPIHLPPLRERVEDIPLLTQYFVDKYMRQLGKSIEMIETKTMERLVSYHWPGNIREMEHLIERALILTQGSTLTITDTLFSASQVPSTAARAPEVPTTCLISSTLEDVEREYILQTLETTGWVVEGPKGAARILDLHPNTLRGRMRRLGIARPH